MRNEIGKTCPDCKTFKIYSEFYKSKTTKDGCTSICKKCRNVRSKKYSKVNKDKIKLYRKEYRELNKDKISKRVKVYQNKYSGQIREYNNKRYKTDIKYNLRVKTSNRICVDLEKYDVKICAPVLNILGCSYSFYEQYIYSKFTKDMNWDRFLKGEIHIDHIKPCISFDLADPEQQKQCFHYSNTQPLWAEDNRIKGANYKSAFDGGEE